MKQHAVALLLQPYKNRLMETAELRKSVNTFAERLLELGAEYPNFHFNVALPGYILELINQLVFPGLREMSRRGCLEWLLTGYTEPFFAFSPTSLTEENIRHGMDVFAELTGSVPAGFLPPFSSWDPAYIATLGNLGINYAVLSSAALPKEAQSACGYWFTEQGGDTISLFPSRLLHKTSAPASIINWLESIVAQEGRPEAAERIITVHYLLSLQPEKGIDSYRWLKSTVRELNKHMLRFRAVLMQEARSMQKPVGIQHLPPCLPFFTEETDSEPHYFLNRLRSFDQVGIMQRKMMDLSEQIGMVKEYRVAERLRKRLFFLQDINRYLPSKNRTRGPGNIEDRLWTYARLIDIETELREREHDSNGRIRITDFLRNGNKSIIMSNSKLTAYCDYKNGGHLYELDYSDRHLNLTAAFNPNPHFPPDVVSPGKSHSAFIDRIYSDQTSAGEIIDGSARDIGTFADGPFEYKIKRTPQGVKAALKGQGGFQSAERSVPLSIEKVFGLEKDDAVFSFVYQLANLSLSSYSFLFAVELHLSLPGVIDRQTRLISGKTVHAAIGLLPLRVEKATRWSISDFVAGVRVQFVTQKPVDLFCLPLKGSDGEVDPACGIKLVLVSPVSLEQSSTWTLVGSIACAKIRRRRKEYDAL